jgi:hypothetical protein
MPAGITEAAAERRVWGGRLTGPDAFSSRGGATGWAAVAKNAYFRRPSVTLKVPLKPPRSLIPLQKFFFTLFAKFSYDFIDRTDIWKGSGSYMAPALAAVALFLNYGGIPGDFFSRDGV